MKESGLLAPTDSRFRGDQRLFEEGKIAEADLEKIRLEEKQRALRKERADNDIEHEPYFFDKTQETDPFTGELVTSYRPKQGQASYWERRKIKDWKDLPEIF